MATKNPWLMFRASGIASDYFWNTPFQKQLNFIYITARAPTVKVNRSIAHDTDENSTIVFPLLYHLEVDKIQVWTINWLCVLFSVYFGRTIFFKKIFYQFVISFIRTRRSETVYCTRKSWPRRAHTRGATMHETLCTSPKMNPSNSWETTSK